MFDAKENLQRLLHDELSNFSSNSGVGGGPSERYSSWTGAHNNWNSGATQTLANMISGLNTFENNSDNSLFNPPRRKLFWSQRYFKYKNEQHINPTGEPIINDTKYNSSFSWVRSINRPFSVTFYPYSYPDKLDVLQRISGQTTSSGIVSAPLGNSNQAFPLGIFPPGSYNFNVIRSLVDPSVEVLSVDELKINYF